MERPSIFEAAGGQTAFVALAHAWHERCLADEVVSHAFSHGLHPDHSARLAAYWAEALGGPPTYSDTIGDHSFALRMHAGNGEHQEMDRRALEAFVLALDDAGLPGDPALRRALTEYFAWGIGAMDTFPDSPDDVPAGLSIPRWTWGGLTESQ